MPLALATVDRELVKALILQGLKHDEVVRQTGVKPATLRTWANRYGWNTLIAKSKVIRETVQIRVEKSQTGQSDSVKALATTGDSVRRSLADEALEAAATLKTFRKPKSREKLAEHLALVQQLVDISKPTFAWNEQGPQTFDIALLSQAEVIREGQVPRLGATDPVLELPASAVVVEDGPAKESQPIVLDSPPVNPPYKLIPP